MSEKEPPASQTVPHPRYPGYCSFCRRNYKDAGPLAEGPDQVYICLHCCLACASVIEVEYQRLRVGDPKTQRP
jgi:ClpX C4-type zinc finger